MAIEQVPGSNADWLEALRIIHEVEPEADLKIGERKIDNSAGFRIVWADHDGFYWRARNRPGEPTATKAPGESTAAKAARLYVIAHKAVELFRVEQVMRTEIARRNDPVSRADHDALAARVSALEAAHPHTVIEDAPRVRVEVVDAGGSARVRVVMLNGEVLWATHGRGLTVDTGSAMSIRGTTRVELAEHHVDLWRHRLGVSP